jgi:hypothetical protein
VKVLAGEVHKLTRQQLLVSIQNLIIATNREDTTLLNISLES